MPVDVNIGTTGANLSKRGELALKGKSRPIQAWHEMMLDVGFEYFLTKKILINRHYSYKKIRKYRYVKTLMMARVYVSRDMRT